MERAMKVPERQSGFALVAAVFLIIVLALAASFMVRFAGSAYGTQAQQVLTNRARQAAMAAVEYGVSRVAEASVCNPSTTITITAYTQFSTVVTCETDNYLGGITIYRISGSASFGQLGQPEYIWRQYHAAVEL